MNFNFVDPIVKFNLNTKIMTQNYNFDNSTLQTKALNCRNCNFKMSIKLFS